MKNAMREALSNLLSYVKTDIRSDEAAQRNYAQVINHADAALANFREAVPLSVIERKIAEMTASYDSEMATAIAKGHRGRVRHEAVERAGKLLTKIEALQDLQHWAE